METCIDGIPVVKLEIFGLKQGKRNKVHKGTHQKFIRGPLPLIWIYKASEIGGKALNVSLALFYKFGFNPNGEITLSQSLLKQFSCGARQTQHKTLKQMEDAGLITVQRRQGACPRVQIVLPTTEKPSEGIL